MVDANFGYLSSSRAYGLGAAESLLAINLFLGLVPTAILIIGCSKNVFYIFGYIAILFAALLVGSTGFILGILLLILTIGLVFIYGSFYQKSSLAIIGTVGFFILFSLALSISLSILSTLFLAFSYSILIEEVVEVTLLYSSNNASAFCLYCS